MSKLKSLRIYKLAFKFGYFVFQSISIYCEIKKLLIFQASDLKL